MAYKSYNSFKITSGLTWTHLIYIYIYIYELIKKKLRLMCQLCIKMTWPSQIKQSPLMNSISIKENQTHIYKGEGKEF